MIYVIPMAGRGSRTKPLGEFKPFIEINGHKILSWFISSMKHNINPEDAFVLITTQYFHDTFNFEEETKKIFLQHELKNNLFYISTDGKPKGSTETIIFAEKYINKDEPVAIVNPDQYVDFDMPETIENNSGYLGLYLNYGEKTGFVRIEDGLIQQFIERKNISNIASSGIFVCSSGKSLIEAGKKQLDLETDQDGEYYIGPTFNYLIEDGFKVHPIIVRCKYDLGTVDNIALFSSRKFNCLI